MKKKILQLCLGLFLGIAGVGMTPQAEAQIPAGKGDVLIGYTGYTEDYLKKFNLYTVDLGAERPYPNLLASPFRDYYSAYGEVIGGTWIKGEWCAIATDVMGEKANFIIYDPDSRTTRYIGRSAVNRAASSSFDMTYDPVTESIYVLYPTSTRSSYLQRLTPYGDTLWDMLATNSILTIDGVQPEQKFRTVAANSRGELYTVYDDGGIYRIDLATLEAEHVMDIPAGTFQMGAFSNSATFASDPDVLYIMAYFRGYHLFRVNLKTEEVVKILDDIEPLVGLCHVDYGENNRYAAPKPIADLRVYKSSVTEATLYFSVPTVNVLGDPLTDRMDVELWRGTDDERGENWELVETLRNRRPGNSEAVEINAETGTYYYALRVKTPYGRYSVDAGIYCSFYDAAIPYATSFEVDDELGAVSVFGKGWKRQENFNSYGAVDTVARTGKYAYAVHNDSVSRLQIGAGLNVYAGVEYELSFYVCAHGKYVYGNRWQHEIKKPLKLTINGKDTTVVVRSPYISETPNPDGSKPWVYPNKDITKYTYTFVPTENRQLEIEFQAMSDDSYYIDDLSVDYKGAISVPAMPDNLEVDEAASDKDNSQVALKFKNPSVTLSGQDLESLEGIVFEYSPYRGFRDELGRDVVHEGKLETTAVGSAATYTMQVPYGGFWYVRAYAYNASGRSPYTATLAVGYAGPKANCGFEVKNSRDEAVKGAAIVLEPLFSAPVEVPDYETATDASGLATLSMYCGRYAVRVGEFWYDTLEGTVNVRRDTTVKVVLADREFHRWPGALQNLRVTATDGAAVKVSLSWRNPDADADGLPLAGLNGLESETIDDIAFYYSTDGSSYEALTTVTAGLTPGAEASCDLTFPKQGTFTLRAVARNRHNTAERYEAVELPVGYIGNGYNPVYVCLAGSQPVAGVRITLVAASGDTAFTATGGADGRVAFSGVLAGTYNLYATADYYDRLIKENMEVSASGDQTLDGFVYTLAQPEITSLEVLGFNSVKWDWNVAADRHFSDGFESYADFAISDIGHYKLGGYKSKGQFGGVTWENMFEDQAYIVFNPSAATPSVADDIYLSARTGSKMLCSFFTIRNDDWLAHKVDGGGTLKFWACGPQISGAAPERFVVLYSSTDDNFANFIPLSDGVYIETEKDWKEYTFELPDNARYFAIHCVSDDASVFKIDDLSYTLNHGATIAKAKEFEVYVDGSKVATVPATVSSYTFDNLHDGPRTLGLKAVYENGTSEMVTRNVVMGRQIVNPVGLAVNNVGRNFIFTYRMPSGSTADYFQIFLDGRHIKNTLALIDTLPTMTMNAEHKAGVCAVYNNHFSDTVTITFRSELANETLEEAGMSLYPNPSSDGLFKLRSVRNGMATVFTADGRRLRTWTLTPGLMELNMAAYPQGVYHLAIQLDNGRRYAVKLIITR